jgi:hypothetical protein
MRRGLRLPAQQRQARRELNRQRPAPAAARRARARPTASAQVRLDRHAWPVRWHAQRMPRQAMVRYTQERRSQSTVRIATLAWPCSPRDWIPRRRMRGQTRPGFAAAAWRRANGLSCVTGFSRALRPPQHAADTSHEISAFDRAARPPPKHRRWPLLRHRIQPGIATAAARRRYISRVSGFNLAARPPASTANRISCVGSRAARPPPGADRCSEDHPAPPEGGKPLLRLAVAHGFPGSHGPIHRQAGGSWLTDG